MKIKNGMINQELRQFYLGKKNQPIYITLM
jgi:hypothetical protein